MTRLFATTDVFVDILHNGLFLGRRNIESLMSYLASIGVERVEWIVDDVWTLYEAYPHGLDLLAEAVAAAHREGLELHAVYKPFEGALHAYFLPHEAPVPEGVPVWRDLRGLLPVVRPFVASHPEFCMERRPGLEDAGQPLEAVRLYFDADDPNTSSANECEIWVGRENGRFEAYEGPARLSDATESRTIDGRPFLIRTVTLQDLDIPPEYGYIEIRSADVAPRAPAFAPVDWPIELVDRSGAVVPSSLAAPRGAENTWLWLRRPVFGQLVRWASTREARSFLDDEERIALLGRDTRMYGAYGERTAGPRAMTGGCIAAARGRPRYLPGVLNPVYPAVRAHWLSMVEYCLDRKVDGVNIRHTHHLRPFDMRDYGYNPPVLERSDGRPVWPKAAGVIGRAYTEFLRTAADMVHGCGRRFGVHLFAEFLKPPADRSVRGNLFPAIGSDWETWIDEFADYAEFRGSVGDDREALESMVMPFARRCRRRNVPLIYQSRRVPMAEIDRQTLAMREDTADRIGGEMELIAESSEIAAYLLYETGVFTRHTDDGCFETSIDLERLVRSRLR